MAFASFGRTKEGRRQARLRPAGLSAISWQAPSALLAGFDLINPKHMLNAYKLKAGSIHIFEMHPINFRECKQYFGLSDFKNTKQERVSFSLNLAFTLCGISLILRQGYQELFGLPFVSTEDVKTMERAAKMAEIIISATSKADTNIFNPHKIREFAKLEAINL